MNKNKCIYSILILLLCSIIPIFTFASNNTTYVWSQISNPTVETVASLNKDKREFFKSNLW